MTSQAVALYVHLPYCLAKCPYCDFNSYAARAWPEDAYADALLAELGVRAAEPPFRDARFASVFFGGGTPSLFAPATIGRLLRGVAERVDVARDAEITLEANPGTVDQARLAGFRAAGVNRISFGVQSFQPALLEALGRRHSVDDSRRALASARAAGFTNLSLDLIYAVPGQDVDACRADLDEAIATAPEHVSAYNLTYEKGTAMHRDLHAGRIRPAPEELEVALFHLVRETLGDAGYAQYEISNYARAGRASRHNQAYWRGRPYLGIGAGACSFVPRAGEPAGGAGSAPSGTSATSQLAPAGSWGTRWENVRDPNRYMEAARAGGRAVGSSEELTRAQAMGEACWLGLRERRGLDPDAFAARFGEPLDAAFPHVAELVTGGLAEWDDEGRLRLTTQGLLVADTVFASFL